MSKTNKQMTYEECWKIQGVTRCEDCSIYNKCCEYGDEQRERLAWLNTEKEAMKT
jgi:hypothetical protein